MTRVINTAENNLQAQPPRIVTVAAGVAIEALPEMRQKSGEIAYRYIQNIGADPLYYSFGISLSNGGPACNDVDTFHGVLPQYSQLDCSNHRMRVSVYSSAGTTVATTIVDRIQG